MEFMHLIPSWDVGDSVIRGSAVTVRYGTRMKLRLRSWHHDSLPIHLTQIKWAIWRAISPCLIDH